MLYPIGNCAANKRYAVATVLWCGDGDKVAQHINMHVSVIVSFQMNKNTHVTNITFQWPIIAIVHLDSLNSNAIMTDVVSHRN